ncbi:hypothetical protein GCM10022196_23200 [Aeromicrobium flavum]
MLVLTAFVLGGCSWGSDHPDPAPTPNPQPRPTQQISLDELGIARWPAPDEDRLPEPPARPEGVEPAEYARMVAAVRTWAIQAATSPETVGTGLPASLKAAIADLEDAQDEAPELARGNVLDPDLEVLTSGLTGAWTVSADDEGSVNVSLQTRTAYEVRSPGGPVRVIGVLRTQGVIGGPDDDGWGTITGWQEFGAADCATVLDGFLTPGGDADDQQADLTTFAEIGNGDEAITPELPDDERVDEEFARTCQAGRV